MKPGSIMIKIAGFLAAVLVVGSPALPQAGKGNLVLSGRVLAEDGSPAAGIRVVIILNDEKKGRPLTQREAVTDAKGNWAVPFIKRGNWVATAFATETMSEVKEVQLAVSRDDVVLVLARKADDILVEAKKAIYRDDFARADAILDWFLQYFPRSQVRDSALFWMAYVNNRLVPDTDASWSSRSCLEKAVQGLDRLIAESPSSDWREDAEILKINVALRLYERGEKRYREVIIKGASDPDRVDVRLAALDALLNVDKKKAFDELRAVVLSAPDPEARKKAILILGRSGGKEALFLLEEVAAKDPDVTVKKAAELWIARRGPAPG
jgi:hypothetical protein